MSQLLNRRKQDQREQPGEMGSGRQEQETEMKRMAEEMRLWCYHEERRKAEFGCEQRLLRSVLNVRMKSLTKHGREASGMAVEGRGSPAGREGTGTAGCSRAPAVPRTG